MMSGLHVLHLSYNNAKEQNQIQNKSITSAIHAMMPVSYVRPTRTKYYFH